LHQAETTAGWRIRRDGPLFNQPRVTINAKAFDEHFRSTPKDAWLKLSWRQYLSWFCKTENFISENGSTHVREWLRIAEQNWLLLDARSILFQEPKNDRSWIRPWRIALNDFERQLSVDDESQ
jgi:hypothetical protein